MVFQKKSWIFSLQKCPLLKGGARAATSIPMVETLCLWFAFAKALSILVRKLKIFNFRTKIFAKIFYFLKGIRRNLSTPYYTFARHRLGPGNGLIPFVCARSSLRSAQATQRTRLNLICCVNVNSHQPATFRACEDLKQGEFQFPKK